MSVETQGNTIGVVIASLRKERKLTQAALARQAGISASAIAMYETDRRTPDRAAIKKLASALHVRMSVLLAAFEANTNEAAAAEMAATAHPSAEPAQGPAEPVKAAVEPAQSTAVTERESGNTNLTQLALSREEARIILFLRMNPQSMPFFQSYIAAGGRRREQLERAWRLIHEFQSVPEQGE